MVNWAADFLAENPALAALPYTRNRHGFTFDLGGGQRRTIVVGRPAHYDAGGGNWQAISTELVDDGTFIGGTGTPAKIRKSNGAIERGANTQRASRLVRYRPSNGNVTNVATIPTTGTVNGESWSRTWGDMTYTVRIHEEGVVQNLVMATLPSLPGGTQPTDYIMVEEHIPGSTLANGWLDTEYTDADGYYHPLPTAYHIGTGPNQHRWDYPVRRLVRSDAQGKWMLTGMLVSDIQTARYPLVIDPDYTADSGDGYLNASESSVSAITWSTVRDTSDGFDSTVANVYVGQQYLYDDKKSTYYGYAYRTYLKFDTSTIPDTDTISAVKMRLTPTINATSVSFDVNIIKYDWSASDPVGSGNRETVWDGILAGTHDDNIWRNTSGMIVAPSTGYDSASNRESGALNTAWVSKTGSTYYGLESSRDHSGTAPTLNVVEYIGVASQNHTTSGYRPVLDVTHAASGTTVTPSTLALTITTYAPTITVTANVTVTPTTLSLATTSYVPVLNLAVIPTTLALNQSTYAPSVVLGEVVTPTTVALVTATFAPTVTASDNQTVTPTTLGLTVSTFAPTVSTSDNQSVTPTTLGLTLATFAPTVTTSDNQLVTPSTLALVLTTYAPTVTVSSGTTVTPTTAALTITTYAPTVPVRSVWWFAYSTTSYPNIARDTAWYSTYGDGSNKNDLTMTSASEIYEADVSGLTGVSWKTLPLHSRTFASAELANGLVIPGSTPVQIVVHGTMAAGTDAVFFCSSGRIVTTGGTVKKVLWSVQNDNNFLALSNTSRIWTGTTASGNHTTGADEHLVVEWGFYADASATTDGNAHLYTRNSANANLDATDSDTTTARDPWMQIDTGFNFGTTVTPSTLTIGIGGRTAPTVTVTENQTATPTTLALTTTAYAPVIKLEVIPPTTALAITTYAPEISNNVLVTPTTASLTATTYAPVVTAGTRVTSETAALTLTTYAPTVTTTLHQTATPSTLGLVLTTYEPTVSTPRLCTPTTLALTISTYAPTITVRLDIVPTTASLVLTTYAPSTESVVQITHPYTSLRVDKPRTIRVTNVPRTVRIVTKRHLRRVL